MVIAVMPPAGTSAQHTVAQDAAAPGGAAAFSAIFDESGADDGRWRTALRDVAGPASPTAAGAPSEAIEPLASLLEAARADPLPIPLVMPDPAVPDLAHPAMHAHADSFLRGQDMIAAGDTYILPDTSPPMAVLVPKSGTGLPKGEAAGTGGHATGAAGPAAASRSEPVTGEAVSADPAAGPGAAKSEAASRTGNSANEGNRATRDDVTATRTAAPAARPDTPANSKRAALSAVQVPAPMAAESTPRHLVEGAPRSTGTTSPLSHAPEGLAGTTVAIPADVRLQGDDPARVGSQPPAVRVPDGLAGLPEAMPQPLPAGGPRPVTASDGNNPPSLERAAGSLPDSAALIGVSAFASADAVTGFEPVPVSLIKTSAPQQIDPQAPNVMTDRPAMTGNPERGADADVLQAARVVASGAQVVPVPQGIPAYWAAREVAAGADATEADTLTTLTTAPSAPNCVEPTPPQPPPRAALSQPTADVGAELLPEAERLSPESDIMSSASAGTATPPVSGQSAAARSGTTALAMPPMLAAQIAAALSARTERPVDLRMMTEELGALQLSLHQDGGLVHVALQADQAETLELLRRNGDLLIQELRAAGFSGATLSFADGGGARDRAMPGAPAAPAPAPTTEPPPPPVPLLLSASARVASGAGLDVRF